MGGYGSGRRWGYSGKNKVEDCYALDINYMVREGVFDGDGWGAGVVRWFNSHTGKETSSIGYEVNAPQRWIRLHYRLVRDNESFDYRNPLTTTNLPWGGVRWWFVCALTCDGQYCGRRVGKLYLPPGGRYYGCRHCYGPTYEGCRESRKPKLVWDERDRELGFTEYDLIQSLKEDQKWDRQIERQSQRNEQRRRRRKARNWA